MAASLILGKGIPSLGPHTEGGLAHDQIVMYGSSRDTPWHVRVAAAAEEVVNVSPDLFRKLGQSEIELYSCGAINTGFTCTACLQHYHNAMQVAAGTVGIDPNL